ncbi:MAG: hypothetical protein KGQ41_06035 [Alphaproteobacteria bacterium]|nr:hypothetical protein [Alphaproteobacteria bacterium]
MHRKSKPIRYGLAALFLALQPLQHAAAIGSEATLQCKCPQDICPLDDQIEVLDEARSAAINEFIREPDAAGIVRRTFETARQYGMALREYDSHFGQNCYPTITVDEGILLLDDILANQQIGLVVKQRALDEYLDKAGVGKEERVSLKGLYCGYYGQMLCPTS